MPPSDIAVRAPKQLDILDASILSGKVQLQDEKEEGEVDPGLFLKLDVLNHDAAFHKAHPAENSFLLFSGADNESCRL